MSGQSFTTVLTVDRAPEEAFDAINNVRGWWTGDIEGGTDKIGDEFTYRYEDVHYSKQRVTELVPGEKIVWLVVDARLNFVKDKAEWKGTEISFHISPKGNGSEIRFTHEGLVPEFECFDACSNAWGSIVSENLRRLIASDERQSDGEESGTASPA